MARPYSLLLEIPLVVFLSAIELRGWNDLRHNRALEDVACFQRRDRLAGLRLLVGIVKENRGTILRAEIGTLSVQRGRIMILEKYSQQFPIGHALGIKFDLNGLGVTGSPRAHVLVGRILRCAACVADGGRGNALHLPERILDTPETARCKSCLSHELQNSPFNSSIALDIATDLARGLAR
jgi:hypothetical protein